MAVLAGAAGCAGPGTAQALTRGDSLTGEGPITFVAGADTSGYIQPLLNRWNAAHPAEKVTLVQLPADADDQHAQMVANLQARSDLYDVFDLDVIWTPEFASQGWIIPLSPRLFPLGKFLPPAVGTARWDGRLWAVPYNSNAGLLFYRKDILAAEGVPPPRTWAQLAADATAIAPRYHMYGYAGQYKLYEGLTVNFAEAVQSAGGAILSGDGKHVALNSSQAREGLQFLVSGIRAGWIPRASLSWDENKASAEFDAGKLLFMRNWPLAYGLAARRGPGNRVTGKVGVAALPGPQGPGSSSLGGGNLAIGAFSRHQRTALQFIQFFTSETSNRQVLTKGSLPPVYAQLYDDPGLIRQYPYLPVLKQAILSAKPRPDSTNYNQLSLAISSSVYQALTMRKSVNDTITGLSGQLTNIVTAG
ncbi:MAG: ABC transporter substrate-binding protein [Actinobacteria bacterium]|nr:ABC transporter substrate-binding protein [Actinomycetota bacterium]